MVMVKDMNREDFFNKLEWEGGVFELHAYGVRPEDIADPELRELWQKFCVVMDLASPIGEQIQDQAMAFWEENDR
jgi:hypothetical protein